MSNFVLSEKEKLILVQRARLSLNEAIDQKGVQLPTYELTENLNSKCGAFASLYKEDDLRACIGQFASSKSLYHVIHEVTRSAALHDHRFAPITINELKQIRIELSILTPLEPIISINLSST